MDQDTGRKRLCQGHTESFSDELSDQRKSLCLLLATDGSVSQITTNVINNPEVKRSQLAQVQSSLKAIATHWILGEKKREKKQIRLKMIELEKEATDEAKAKLEQLKVYNLGGCEEFWKIAIKDSCEQIENYVKEMSGMLQTADSTRTVSGDLLTCRSQQLTQCEVQLEERDLEIKRLKAELAEKTDVLIAKQVELDEMRADITHLGSQLAEYEDERVLPGELTASSITGANMRERAIAVHEKSLDHNLKLSEENGKLTAQLREQSTQIRRATEREMNVTRRLERTIESLEETALELTTSRENLSNATSEAILNKKGEIF